MAKKRQQQRTQRQFLRDVERRNQCGDDAGMPYTAGSWGRKAKTSFRYTYTGNEGKICQLPLTKRKENVLKAIESKGENGIWVKRIEPTVLDALIADEAVYLHRPPYYGSGRNYTMAVASRFPQPDKETRKRRQEETPAQYKQRTLETLNPAPAEESKPKKTIKWTKERHQRLLIDALMGQADEEVVKQVTRTKTKPKKITK